jgi:hypothetical protein
MSNPNDDFWPAEILDTSDPAPVRLLKEQAARLGEKTHNEVEAVVRPGVEGGTTYHSLYLKASALGDYLYKLLFVAYPVVGPLGDDYPVTAQVSWGGPPVEIRNDKEFREWLQEQLSSAHVQKAISNIRRYAHESLFRP